MFDKNDVVDKILRLSFPFYQQLLKPFTNSLGRKGAPIHTAEPPIEATVLL